MISFNCRSMRNKIEDICSLLLDYNIDIVFLQETWLNKGDKSVVFEIKDHGLDMVNVNRVQRDTGGGVAVIFKPGLNIKQSHNKKHTDLLNTYVLISRKTVQM
jgi:exonuclease III